MTDSTSPRFSELLDWLEGKLSADEAQAVAERLKNANATTRTNLAWLRTFLQARQVVKLTAPPAKVREVLKRRFAAYAPQTPRRQPPASFQRWLATLTFDSQARLGTAGLRSASVEGLQRQLIYSTEVAEVVLNLQPHPQGQRLNLSGQVFPITDTPPNAFSLQLLQNTSEVGLAASDDLGEFAFEAIPMGDYELVISAAAFEVVIPFIPLRL
jgi:hypothetical protein